MVLIDTSVLVAVLRDKSGIAADSLFAEIGAEDLALADPVGMELLAGARDENEWESLATIAEIRDLKQKRLELQKTT
jgi:predicted nucleic acid-binding protein